ncbi:MAG: ATP-binding cassette domain-containing protein [Pseudomonadota bacterium]
MTCLAAIGSLGILGAILVGGLRAEPISLAAFAAFNAAFGQFIASVSAFGLALSTISIAIPLASRALPVFSTPPEIKTNAKDPGRLTGRIAVNHLSFRYQDDGPMILDDVSFSAEPGNFIALVGPSGAGKLTVLRLLLGLERPVSGTVFYDAHDLSDLDLRFVRQQIGTVMQSVGVLPGSIYDNIAGARMLSDEVVMAAAEQASLADDIKGFPMGLDTYVSEGGSTLSGGQAQRLMIARAFVGNPAMVFLDEATSALDNHAQYAVQESLKNMGVTRVVIAHRLSTKRNADKILVFEAGRIVETGTYEHLMDQRGAFYRLAKRQLI